VTAALPAKWIKALSLERRSAPELYRSVSEIEPGPYSDAIAYALGDLGMAAVFCIEGVPTIGFLREPDLSPDRLDTVHRILWNQGLLSLLLVVKDDELLCYSLVQRPFERNAKSKADPRLIETLNLVANALQIRELIESTESGRFWYEHDDHFDPSNRVDSVLLANLLEAFRELKPELGNDAAQALLMQTMFIAYLEDRKIIKDSVFRNASGAVHGNFAGMLEGRTVAPFEKLFVWLKAAFNGNVFNAPCAFDISSVRPPKLKLSHLKVLSRFRHGREEMASGQLRLWGYDFQYMPIGLISAVYDRFLKEEEGRKSAEGAFYTPMFLADVAVNQLWDELSDEQRANGVFCDPACGSGIFLVRLFQRLVAHHCRVKRKRHATWLELSAIARRLHGGDINPSAVRVAAFSLYIALLEQSNPPDLPALIEKGKLLPSLYGDTLKPAEDFFSSQDQARYDAILGNPPWKGRAGEITTAQAWSKTHNKPDPAKDIAWAFVWKSLEIVKPRGVIGLLLPAMGVLHNTAPTSQTARRLLLQEARIKRVINLSDLCFQLFDGAKRPTAFVLYQPGHSNSLPYRFEYWVPKADLNLRLKRMMTLARSDRVVMRSDEVMQDPAIFKRRLWTRAPDERLLQYLRAIPSLGKIVQQYKEVAKGEINRATDWIIGQGFKPAQPELLGKPGYSTTIEEEVTQSAYLDANSFTPLALPKVTARPWESSTVHRAGFVEGFRGPHILIPQGVERAVPRLRAAYTEQDLVFEHSIQAIAFPEKSKTTAKLLTAILNSRLAAWFYFHETANLGADRAKVQQNDLIKLPFSLPDAMPDPVRAKIAAREIVRIIDREIRTANHLFRQATSAFEELDALVYAYYGLDESDVALVEDTFTYILPSMQPRRSAGIQVLWKNSERNERRAYAMALSDALAPWFRSRISAALVGKSADIGVLKLSLEAGPKQSMYEEGELDVGDVLDVIRDNLSVTLPGNVQLIPDLRIVIGSEMYLVKPLQMRHWLRSTALADAEQIAAELTSAIARKQGANAAR
jgi:hypothetical protein